ncbi:flippase [Flavobacterium pectinovorum]|uniref:flippase n=1 Tax=Flavobacterium pectinovorum TaxID=29533 RepID=UPI001FAB8BD1|nr:flippase [Flavobacterium pectinovorum]MCI9843862.1 flippase [Flavobacterium pectinovorum]
MDNVLKKNFSYLFLLQNANYIIPLFLLPYLAHNLGTENFGKINFAQAVIVYFSLIIDFGFNVSSTQSIAKVQHDKFEISKIFWNTIYSKFFFSFISFVVLFLIISCVPKLNSISSLLYTAFLGVFSSVFFPNWFFLGIEKMGVITVLNVIPRIIVLVLVFLLIHSKNDYLLALQIQVGGMFLTAIFGMGLVFFKKMVYLLKPDFRGIVLEIKNSWPIFISGVATNLYTTTNLVVLGFLTNDSIVGVYSAADKIIKAIISLLSAVTQVVFPRVNVYFVDSKEKALEFIDKILKLVLVATSIGGVLLLILSPFIVKLLFGLPDYFDSIKVLRITSFLPMFATINGIIAINILITFDLKKVLLKIVAIGGFFSLLFVFPFTYFFGVIGTGLTALGTEILIFCLLLFELRKRDINILGIKNISNVISHKS